MKKIKIFSKLVLITISLLLFLELITRFYLFAKTGETFYFKFNPSPTIEFPVPQIVKYDSYYKFKPGMHRHGSVKNYTINSKGFRGNDFDIKKRPEVIRIVCFGGSSTMGMGVADEETYPFCLEKILEEKFGEGRFEVINAGIASLEMEQIYNLFAKEVINYSPDIVTIYSAFNDANHARKLVFKNSDLAVKLSKALYYRWMLYTVLAEKINVIKNRNPIPFFSNSTEISTESYIENLNKLISLAEEKNIKVILIKQPINVNIKIDFEKETIDSLRNKIVNIDSFKEKRLYTQYLLVKEMERIGNNYSLVILDPLDKFKENREKYFLSEVHLSVEGHRRLAEIIAGILIR